MKPKKKPAAKPNPSEFKIQIVNENAFSNTIGRKRGLGEVDDMESMIQPPPSKRPKVE